MPISKKYKLGFVHIPKTGGSTIEKTLGMFEPESLFNERRKDRAITPQHLPFSLIPEEVKMAIPIWFSVVRNPYSRLVSEYHFITENKNNLAATRYFHKNFDDFVQDSLSLEREERIHIFDNHLEPQYYFLEGGYFINLFKFERLDVCFQWLKTITEKELVFGWERKSIINKNFTNYYSDKKTIELVNKFYEKDFIRFNYPLLNH